MKLPWHSDGPGEERSKARFVQRYRAATRRAQRLADCKTPLERHLAGRPVQDIGEKRGSEEVRFENGGRVLVWGWVGVSKRLMRQRG